MMLLTRVWRAVSYQLFLARYYWYYPTLRHKMRTILQYDESAVNLADGEQEERALPGFKKHRNTGYHRYMLSRYLYAITFVHDKHVLEVGSGLGWGAHLISDYPASLLCIDRDRPSIEFARRVWRDPQVVFEERSVEQLHELKRSFDVVLAFELIEHLEFEQGKRLITQLARILEPGGLLVMSSYFPDREADARQSETKNPYHPHVYTKTEMRSLLTAQRFSSCDFVLDLILVARK